MTGAGSEFHTDGARIEKNLSRWI